MLQQKEPEDFVIATGEAHSVRELVELAFQEIGSEIVYVGAVWSSMYIIQWNLRIKETPNKDSEFAFL